MIRNMLRQPKCSVRKPPKNGPAESPRYTEATLIPRARPLSPAGKADVRMAIDGPKIMAPPMPWNSLKKMRE